MKQTLLRAKYCKNPQKKTVLSRKVCNFAEEITVEETYEKEFFYS